MPTTDPPAGLPEDLHEYWHDDGRWFHSASWFHSTIRILLLTRLADAERRASEANKTVKGREAELSALRRIAREQDFAVDERDALLRDAKDVGAAIGCAHPYDGHARCVREVIRQAHADRDRLAERLRVCREALEETKARINCNCGSCDGIRTTIDAALAETDK